MYFICRRQKIYKKVFVKGIVIIMYEIILGVEGMRCGMCEAHVNDAIRNNFKVKRLNHLMINPGLLYYLRRKLLRISLNR